MQHLGVNYLTYSPALASGPDPRPRCDRPPKPESFRAFITQGSVARQSFTTENTKSRPTYENAASLQRVPSVAHL